MKSAKSYKISILIIAFLLSIVAGFCSMQVGTVKADTTIADAKKSFLINDVVETSKIDFDGTHLVATLKNGDEFKIKNELVIDDFGIELKVPKQVKKLSIKLVTDSYLINGNPVGSGEDLTYKNEIETVYTVEFTETGYKFSVNSNDTPATETAVTLSNEDRTVLFNSSVVNRNVSAKVYVQNEESAILTAKVDNNSYLVETVDKTTAKVSVVIEEVVDGTESVYLKVASISQKASDVNKDYYQTFELSDNNSSFEKSAYPRVTLNDDAFIKDNNGDYKKLVMAQNVQESYTLNVYSVLGDYTSSNVWLYSAKDGNTDNTEENPNAWTPNGVEKPKKIAFTATGDFDFNVVAKVDDKVETFETYSVKVINGDKTTTLTDTTAPQYIKDTENYYDAIIGGYKSALEKAVYKEVTVDDQTKTVSVSLGTEVELPSMRDLVFDEYTPYEDLTVSLKYFTRTASKQSSSELEFKVTVAGDYVYYAVFTDKAGNSMEEDDFIKIDEDDSNVIVDGVYKPYVFTFNVQDNAPIDIETSTAQGVGYIGIQYKAAKFKIQADGCTTTYTLSYRKTESDEWKVIPAVSKVDKNYNANGYTYDDVKAIGYDGELTFTPTAKGYYKIDCVATSEYTTRTDSASSEVYIGEKPVYVELPNYWLRDNVWSVVFLSVGTLCLIGIIVLLCIKPKEETESD